MTAPTAPNTLTERYIQEVVRRIPADQRDDVADELRATIADTVEARGGEAAERAVITEMGDPIRLAAQYRDRPLALIGPDFYPAYIRLLKMLMTVVLPIVVVVVVAVDAFDDNNIGHLIGTGIGAVLSVGAQMFAWLTVVFALLDRVKRHEDVRKSVEWTPDTLPPVRKPDKGGPAAFAAIVWYAFLAGAIVWQHLAEPWRPEFDGLTYDGGVEVLNPSLWSNWIWPILAGLAAMAVLEGIRIGQRGWTMGLVIAYAVAEAVFALPLAALFYNQRILNPSFLSDINRDWTTPDAFYTVAAVIVIAISVTETYKRFKAVAGK